MRSFKWIAEIEISENWVIDGFDLDAEVLSDLLQELSWASPSEVKVRIVSAPDPKEIEAAKAEFDLAEQRALDDVGDVDNPGALDNP